MMKRVGLKMSSLLLGASALIGASCESTTKVGSECVDGVCPRANSVTQQTCLLTSSFQATFDVVNDGEHAIAANDYVCIGHALPLDRQWRVACQMRWSLGTGSSQPASGAPKRCSDAPFLEPVDEGVDDVCVVAQIAADEVGAGDDGWFYSNSIEACLLDEAVSAELLSAPGIRFTAGAQPPAGTTVEITCSRAQTIAKGAPVSIDAVECERTESETFDIGAACLPEATRAGGFDSREASVEVRSDQCQSEVCLVFGLQGQPQPECKASEPEQCHGAPIRQAPAEEIERSVYCSCRCDAPEGDPGPLCDCVDGFSCVEAIADGPPGIRGSYCVRNDSLPE